MNLELTQQLGQMKHLFELLQQQTNPSNVEAILNLRQKASEISEQPAATVRASTKETGSVKSETPSTTPSTPSASSISWAKVVSDGAVGKSILKKKKATSVPNADNNSYQSTTASAKKSEISSLASGSSRNTQSVSTNK